VAWLRSDNFHVILADHLVLCDVVHFVDRTHGLELVKNFLHTGHNQTEVGGKLWDQTVLRPLVRIFEFGVFTAEVGSYVKGKS
jgi:hypothetical protein